MGSQRIKIEQVTYHSSGDQGSTNMDFQGSLIRVLYLGFMLALMPGTPCLISSV